MNIGGFDIAPTVNMLLIIWLPVLVSAIVAYAFREARALRPAVADYFNAHTTAKERELAERVARIGVLMAEQVAARSDVQQAAAAKQQLAFTYINNVLGQHGITLQAQDVYALIEATVRAELNQNRPVAVPAGPTAPASN